MDKNMILNYFLELVKIPSPSKNERKLADKLIKDLQNLGFDVREDNAASKVGGNTGNIIARLKGDPEKTPIILSCHMDTVAGESIINPVVKDGMIYSDGTTILSADDKAGITGIIMGLKSLLKKEINHGDIEVVLTVCEEIGLLGSKNLDLTGLGGKMAYILDSSGDIGGIISSAPAQVRIEIKIHGKAAHAGIEPEKGISAIQVAAEGIAKMNLGRIDFETTANVGVIRGGSATNIVTELVEIEAEARSRDPHKLKLQSDHMIECIKNAASRYGASYEYEVIEQYSHYKFSGEEEIIKRLEKSMNKLGIKPVLEVSGGGSDANIFNGFGIPAVNIAVGYEKPHSKEESIPVENLYKICNLVETLLSV